MSSYGLSNEVERGTLQTMTKLIVSILLVIVLLIFALHEDSWGVSIVLGPIYIQGWCVAICALISVLLACGLGLCISLLVGLPWTTITPVIVFLAIGLGVDNCVLFTILYYRGDRHTTHDKKMTDAASEAALFNTLSTLTTVLAFISKMLQCYIMRSGSQLILQRHQHVLSVVCDRHVFGVHHNVHAV